MKKQTAVEWLVEKNSEQGGIITPQDWIKAKQMEKEQIMEAWREGLYHYYDGINLQRVKYKDYLDYYNKVYNQP